MLNKHKKNVSNGTTDDREILRRLGDIFSAHPDDVVRSLERFKRELDASKKALGE